MYSVTRRIQHIKQPHGGYIRASFFGARAVELCDNKTLHPEENVHHVVVGLVVDYLTRFMINGDVNKSFHISIYGALVAHTFGENTELQETLVYINNIKGLDDKSIISACKMVTYDVWVRNPFRAKSAKSAKDTNPDKKTCENIRIMVERGITFFKEYGPITVDGFTFEPNGYTSTVSSGDGDFLTEDTLWDFKVSKYNPNSKHTLQLLMYWIMGQHSGKEEFKNITKLGVFNPRLNKVYSYDMKFVSPETIAEVERDVICYKLDKNS